jgi:HSP20 family protein
MQPTRSSPQTSQGPQPYNLFSLPLEWGRMMEAFISGAGSLTPFGSPMGLLSPVRIDVLEDESAFELVAEMPGVQAQDIDVELEGQELRISAQKNGESQHQSDRFHLKERSFGHFSRSVMLPFPADVEQVCADFSNGILTVRVPKPEALQRTQHIRVRDRGKEGGVPTTHLEPSADGLRPGIGLHEEPDMPPQDDDEGGRA